LVGLILVYIVARLISTGISKISSHLQVISQGDFTRDVSEKIENTSAVAEEVSASSEEIAASTEEMKTASSEVSSSAEMLNNMTQEMIVHVDKFKI